MKKLIKKTKVILFNNKYKQIIIICVVFLFSCEDFVEIDPPRTDLTRETVFASDATAEAAMFDIYYNMRGSGFASGSIGSISYNVSLSSDELNDLNPSSTVSQRFDEFSENQLTSTNSSVADLWSQLYLTIYKTNSIIEGLESSSGVSENLKNQLLGEAKFIRAFCHFYLVNLWGDIPLITTTDYESNTTAERTLKEEVYDQIILDLLDAQSLLLNDYSFSSGERTRVNKGAATAMLARVYLYLEDWQNADIQSSNIIGETSLYSLEPDLNNVFFATSSEAIWQLESFSTSPSNDFIYFYLLASLLHFNELNSQFAESFETGDERSVIWIGHSTYYYASKYKSSKPKEEYSTVLRLAEQYLIRAEARVEQGNIIGAQEDINVIRNRANLATTSANNKTSILLAIEQERKAELFTEWGHRWLDLKRTSRIDEVLGIIKSEWSSTDALYPIPEIQLLNDPAMKDSQNPGY